MESPITFEIQISMFSDLRSIYMVSLVVRRHKPSFT
jgi:hypothetical protein